MCYLTFCLVLYLTFNLVWYGWYSNLCGQASHTTQTISLNIIQIVTCMLWVQTHIPAHSYKLTFKEKTPYHHPPNHSCIKFKNGVFRFTEWYSKHFPLDPTRWRPDLAANLRQRAKVVRQKSVHVQLVGTVTASTAFWSACFSRWAPSYMYFNQLTAKR